MISEFYKRFAETMIRDEGECPYTITSEMICELADLLETVCEQAFANWIKFLDENFDENEINMNVIDKEKGNDP